MLKADAQEVRPVDRRPVLLTAIGIAAAAVVPAFLVFGRRWHAGGVMWGPLDGVATVALFASPAVLAALAIVRRRSLLLAAAGTVVIALPLWIFMPFMVVAAVLWTLARDRQGSRQRVEPRQLAAAMVSAALVVAAAGVFFFVRSATVCTSEIRYGDGTVRRATRVSSDPNRHTETIPYRPGEQPFRSSTTCSEAALLPERSLAILGLVSVAFGAGFVFAVEPREAAA